VKLAELMTAQVFFGVDGIYIYVFTHIQKNGTLSTSTGDLNLGWMNLFSLHKKTDLFLSSELKHKKTTGNFLTLGGKDSRGNTYFLGVSVAMKLHFQGSGVSLKGFQVEMAIITVPETYT